MTLLYAVQKQTEWFASLVFSIVVQEVHQSDNIFDAILM